MTASAMRYHAKRTRPWRVSQWTRNRTQIAAVTAATTPPSSTFDQPKTWIIQLSIPLDQYSETGPVKPGSSVYMNLFRGVRLGEGDTLCLSPTFNPGAFHNVPRMAELKLAE